MFYNIFEKNVAVAAAALMGGPPNCSHSITFFVNVNISKVLATFSVNAEARAGDRLSLALLSARTPKCKHCLGNKKNKSLNLKKMSFQK